MATLETVYLGELRTESQHLNSGIKIITDAPLDNNGRGEAFSPTDLVASALGSCMLTIMGILSNRESIDIVGTKLSVTKIMTSEPPRKIAKIEVIFTVPSEKVAVLTDNQKQKLKNAAHTCPVALSLHPEIEQNIVFNF